MKHYTDITRSYPDKVLDSIICDVCNRTHTHGHWKRAHSYEVQETEVSYKYGEAYPEGGGGSEYVYDICPDCFRNVLVPLLESIGVHPQIVDWEVG